MPHDAAFGVRYSPNNAWLQHNGSNNASASTNATHYALLYLVPAPVNCACSQQDTSLSIAFRPWRMLEAPWPYAPSKFQTKFQLHPTRRDVTAARYVPLHPHTVERLSLHCVDNCYVYSKLAFGVYLFSVVFRQASSKLVRLFKYSEMGTACKPRTSRADSLGHGWSTAILRRQ